MDNLEDSGKYVPNLNIPLYGSGNAAYTSVFICTFRLQYHVITQTLLWVFT